MERDGNERRRKLDYKKRGWDRTERGRVRGRMWMKTPIVKRSSRLNTAVHQRAAGNPPNICTSPEEEWLTYRQLQTAVAEMATMRSVCVSPCLLLLLLCCVAAHRVNAVLTKSDEDTKRDMLAIDILNHSGVLNSLLQSERRTMLRSVRAPRPLAQVPKRAQQGSRFALSLDVPTSILSVLIDLAKNQDMRTKAAANAELMARIGKRK
ncbi:uncharacterized protein LOC128760594 [Synchiropus splendidus]|uniref:uncharacterized protein LOC128760594 n=1 Tax=Synchiropus splendidus TaxID=270530 RepID=UPI00237E280B|nr:uncharacterized protein LOC128760594 [Synchiropus splendidus]